MNVRKPDDKMETEPVHKENFLGANTISDLVYRASTSILYHRGVCPREDFKNEEHGDMQLYRLQNRKTNDLVWGALVVLDDCLVSEVLEKIVLAIINENSKKIVEQWDFQVEIQRPQGMDKPKQQIEDEMFNVLKQIPLITAKLPSRNYSYSFGFLIYSPDSLIVTPIAWRNAVTPRELHDYVEVGLLSTTIHKIRLQVRYAREVDDRRKIILRESKLR
ncbi:hypothetical protein ILUMI_02537 [Ignelater luminosus]|uniref:HORMA domain-containing protein n=1 Tax=Ignelater luminosus TaxID=2038154 RepID=A0A8K0DCF1_IGNLU|nr:hypothetical protein ILUMI_02537 [Ignelater luminosus]